VSAAPTHHARRTSRTSDISSRRNHLTGRATGQRVGKHRVEALAARAAVEVEDFYLTRRAPTGEAGDVLVISLMAKES